MSHPITAIWIASSPLAHLFSIMYALPMTTKRAMKLLGADTEYALAKLLGIKHQAVYAWRGQVPEKRQWQVQILAAKRGKA